jgi:hypothetical protein
VNQILQNRYQLPPLDLGVGMAMSKAVVTLVGLANERHPKAVGQCVYYATKLAGGKNEILVDAVMNSAWPVAKEKGGLKFRPKKVRNVDGFLVT